MIKFLCLFAMTLVVIQALPADDVARKDLVKPNEPVVAEEGLKTVLPINEDPAVVAGDNDEENLKPAESGWGGWGGYGGYGGYGRGWGGYGGYGGWGGYGGGWGRGYGGWGRGYGGWGRGYGGWGWGR